MEESLLMKKCENPGRSDNQEKDSSPKPSQSKTSDQHHRAQEDARKEPLALYLFWLAYIFLEIPARRILVATFELKDGSPSPQALANILVGIALMPVFAISWLVRIIFLNVQDAV